MRVAIPKEIYPRERRVAATPDTVAKLAKLGLEVLVQTGAGEQAGYGDDAYAAAGARLIPQASALFGQGDIVLKVRPPEPTEVDAFKMGAVLIASTALPAPEANNIEHGYIEETHP